MIAKVIKTKHYKSGKSLWANDIVTIVTPIDNQNSIVKVYKEGFIDVTYSVSRKNLELI